MENKKIAAALGIAAIPVAAAAGICYKRRKNLEKDSYDLWNDTADLYNLKFAINHKTYAELIALIRDELTPNMRVLEIAASTGEIARGIASECGHVIASDFSDEMIKVAKKKGTPENLMWDVQDAACLTYPDESFDAVIIANAMNVIPYPEDVLAQAERVLKEDGILIIPNYIKTGRCLEKVRVNARKLLGYQDYNTWTFDGYLDFITMNGWKVIREDLIPGSMPIAFMVAMKNR